MFVSFPFFAKLPNKTPFDFFVLYSMSAACVLSLEMVGLYCVVRVLSNAHDLVDEARIIRSRTLTVCLGGLTVARHQFWW